jgi:dihydrofolate synthase/folylpolyglutamate synthase
MNFEESYQYLLSLGNEVSAMKLGLESMTKLLSELGDPQKNYLKVQVAGTNGKGSVCAFLEAICVSAGIHVGVTTSPHLISVAERVRVDGKPISEDYFADLASRVRAAAEQLVKTGELEIVPTYFEQVTAIALLAFAEVKVKLAILETGLGGRLDATTAANAEIAVITRIDLDHQQYLGETIGKIAAEKAAIIHEGSNVVISEQADEAIPVILGRCSEFNIEPRSAKDVTVERNVGGLVFATSGGRYQVDVLGIVGEHQIENAKSAIIAAEFLGAQFEISTSDIEIGLASACHHGRLELRGKFLFDGAHNIGGAKALRAYLDDFIDKPITMIFGMMKDKDVGAVAEILFPTASTLILTRPNNERAMSPSELASLALSYNDRSNVITTESVAEALEIADKRSESDSVILITGSLYLVGEAQMLLRQQSKI